MKKKLTAFLSVITLSIFIPLIPANAAVKAGASCKTAGITSVATGKTFTCIKSGKKLIWNKGVVIAQPKSSPVQTIEDDSVIISRLITYRYVNGILERQANTSGKFYSTDSRKVTSFDPIRVKAYEEIRAQITNAPHPNFQFKWDVKTQFPSEIAAYSKDYVEAAASFWGSVFKEQLTVPAQLVTEQDLEWEKTQEIKFSDTVDILTRFTTDDYKRSTPFMAGGAHYWQKSPNDPKVYSLLNFQTPSYATSSRIASTWVMVPAHEVTHIVQDYYRKGIGGNDIAAFDLRTNATFQEGTATLFGYGISMKNIGWYSDGLDEYLYGNFKNDTYWKPVKTVDDVINILQQTEARTNNSTHNSSYPIGAMLYEWVIAKYGFDSYMRILENLSKNSDYSDTIKAALGISKVELYQSAAPYILATFKRLNL